ncbi:TPA: hypothetical protein ACX6RJ_003767 [Photobacterium damselae]
MEPSKQLIWVKGLKTAYQRLGATQRDQYSWVAKTDETYVFSAEIDHKDPENNKYNHKAGTFFKRVPAMTKDLDYKSLSISHSKELFEAITDAWSRSIECYVIQVKGTRFGTTKGDVKAGYDGHLWVVKELSGSVEKGYEFKLCRTR